MTDSREEPCRVVNASGTYTVVPRTHCGFETINQSMAKSRCLADPFTIIFNNTHSHRLALDPAVCPVCSVRNTQAGSEFFQPGLCRFPPLCAFLNRCLWLSLTAFRPLARRPADPWSCLACPPPPLCYTSLSRLSCFPVPSPQKLGASLSFFSVLPIPLLRLP